MEKKKMNLWKKILIVVLVVVVIFVICTLRKMFILISLDNKVSELENTKNNIYSKIVIERDEMTNETEVFIKDDVNKSKAIMKKSDEVMIELIQITYPNERKVFKSDENGKTLTVYKEKTAVRGADLEYSEDIQTSYTAIVNFAQATILPERILHSIFTEIREVELDGKECYELSGNNMSLFIKTSGTERIYGYVEKETGLPIKRIDLMEDGREDVTTYDYKFDIVTDEDLKEPDVSEYKLQE